MVYHVTVSKEWSGDMATVNYVVEGNGPPLTLIHGVGANLQSWDPVVSRLSGMFTILRMDMRGHGKTSGITPKCTLDSFADDVHQSMGKAGFERSHIAGFSLGGMVAQLIAVKHPERVSRLALLNAVADRLPEERKKLRGRAEIIRKDGIGSIIEASKTRWFTEAFQRDHPELVERRLQEMRDNDPDSYAEAYRIFATSDVGDRVHQIQNNTLIVTSEFDQGSSPRMAHFMHNQIRYSELVIIPRLKHSVLMEAPDILSGMLMTFLTRKD